MDDSYDLDFPDWNSIETVILLQQKNYGDALLLLPVISSILAFKSNIRIVACVPEVCHPLLQVADNVTCLGSTSLLELFFKLNHLGRRAALLDFQPTLRFRVLGRLIGCGLISGLVKNKRLFTAFDTHSPRPMISNRPQYQSNLDVIRRLGCDAYFPVDCLQNLAIQFPKFEYAPNDRYVVIQPGSRWMFKSFSAAQWVGLARMVQRTFDCTIIVTGGDSPQEVSLGVELDKLDKVISMVGRTSILELTVLLRDSQGYVGIDTFTSHLAAFLGIPGVVIFGPSDKVIWGPVSGSRLAIVTPEKGDFPCMPCNQDGCGGSKISECLYSVKPEMVLATLEAQMHNLND